jgi:hypothetical protein
MLLAAAPSGHPLRPAIGAHTERTVQSARAKNRRRSPSVAFPCPMWVTGASRADRAAHAGLQRPPLPNSSDVRFPADQLGKLAGVVTPCRCVWSCAKRGFDNRHREAEGGRPPRLCRSVPAIWRVCDAHAPRLPQRGNVTWMHGRRLPGRRAGAASTALDDRQKPP